VFACKPDSLKGAIDAAAPNPQLFCYVGYTQLPRALDPTLRGRERGFFRQTPGRMARLIKWVERTIVLENQ
jgi:hypothetical protein